SGARGGSRGCGRARGHQEGQEGRRGREEVASSGCGAMRAIVGLGNPGAGYRHTRHNIGFDGLDELARTLGASFRLWKGLAEAALVKQQAGTLPKTQTFMNASGEAVQRIASFYKPEPADMLIVIDEVQLPVGRIRL